MKINMKSFLVISERIFLIDYIVNYNSNNNKSLIELQNKILQKLQEMFYN